MQRATSQCGTTSLLERYTHRIGGALGQAPVQDPTEDDAGKNVADAQYERYVADDLPGTSVSLVLINALDGEEANIGGQDDGCLCHAHMRGQRVLRLSGDGEDTYRCHRIRPILSKVGDECTPPADASDYAVH